MLQLLGNLQSHLTCLAEVTSSQSSLSPKRYGSSSLGDISVVLVVSPESYLSSQKQYRILRDHVKTFADQQGGIVLFCGLFSSFIKPTSFDSYFRNEWNLPWRFGAYHRTTLTVNQNFHITSKDSHTPVKLDPKTASLEKAYSQKAVNVKNVPMNSMLYVTTSASQLESLVFPPQSVDNKSQSPVIFQSYGNGYVGYLGDVNAEVGTTKAILALCCLTDGHQPPTTLARTSDPNTGGQYCSGCRKQEMQVKDSHGSEKYKRCAKCQVCYYCSSRCQIAHWREGHKEDCKYMKDDDDSGDDLDED